MRALPIVNLQPGIEAPLHGAEIGKAFARDHLALERALKRSFLRCVLGCSGRPCSGAIPSRISHAVSLVWRCCVVLAPRRSVVHQHALGQPIAAEAPSGPQPRCAALVGTRRSTSANASDRRAPSADDSAAPSGAKCPLKSICHSSLETPSRSAAKADAAPLPPALSAHAGQNAVMVLACSSGPTPRRRSA